MVRLLLTGRYMDRHVKYDHLMLHSKTTMGGQCVQLPAAFAVQYL